MNGYAGVMKLYPGNICAHPQTCNVMLKVLIAIAEELKLNKTYIFFQFDSGSPLVCNGKLIGINSWGSENIKIPAIYTFIPYFESWIQETYRTLIVSQYSAVKYFQFQSDAKHV